MSNNLKRPVTLQQAIVYFSHPDRAFRYAIVLHCPTLMSVARAAAPSRLLQNIKESG